MTTTTATDLEMARVWIANIFGAQARNAYATGSSEFDALAAELLEAKAHLASLQANIV